MFFRDLREWLQAVEDRGELQRISGASPDLEMSGIAEIMAQGSEAPMPVLQFDSIPGFPAGYKTLFGMLASPRRLALSLGLPENQLDRVSLTENWRKVRRNLQLLPPKTVDSGPVLENVFTGEDVDLCKFPVPRIHELDGGPYFGTAHVVITRGLSSPWVNLGVYRNMLVDRNRLAIHMQSSHDGGIMLREYMAQKKAMPIAIALGVDPALWFTAFTHLPRGVSEYDYAGGIRGEAIETIQGPYTGLPIPAHAEIAVEGEIVPGEMVDEGPFGEWHGYYANRGLEKESEPVIRVKTVLHRNEPILTGIQLAKPPHEYTLGNALSQSARIWDALESCSVPGITGLWCHECGIGQLLTVIALQTSYAGHSRQAALIASQLPELYGRYTIVVDEDIDPANLNEVMWAVTTRADPERAIEILRYCRSASSDPAVSIVEKRKTRILFNSRAIIDACRPYEWKEEYYPIAQLSPELRASLLTKWDHIFKKRP